VTVAVEVSLSAGRNTVHFVSPGTEKEAVVKALDRPVAAADSGSTGDNPLPDHGPRNRDAVRPNDLLADRDADGSSLGNPLKEGAFTSP
jgi:hypothetical protein